MSADPTLVVHPTKQALAEATAARLVVAAVDAVAERGRARLVLTGGSMGSAVLAAVGSCPAAAALDWSRVELWWGDERFLAAGDPDRNDTQADEALLDSLGLDSAQVHRVATSDGPDGDDVDAAARRYADELAAAGDGGLAPEFDVVLLGVGPDCHVASLFPGHPGTGEGGTGAIAVRDSPKPPPTRVSMTFDALGHGREVWLVVAGEDKAEAVATAWRLAAEGGDASRAPASLVRGRTATRWLVDAPAAADLG